MQKLARTAASGQPTLVAASGSRRIRSSRAPTFSQRRVQATSETRAFPFSLFLGTGRIHRLTDHCLVSWVLGCQRRQEDSHRVAPSKSRPAAASTVRFSSCTCKENRKALFDGCIESSREPNYSGRAAGSLQVIAQLAKSCLLRAPLRCRCSGAQL